MEKENLLFKRGNDRNLCLQASALHHVKSPQPSMRAKVQAPEGLRENSTLKRQLYHPRARSVPAERGWSSHNPQPSVSGPGPSAPTPLGRGLPVLFPSSVALLALVTIHQAFAPEPEVSPRCAHRWGPSHCNRFL